MAPLLIMIEYIIGFLSLDFTFLRHSNYCISSGRLMHLRLKHYLFNALCQNNGNIIFSTCILGRLNQTLDLFLYTGIR